MDMTPSFFIPVRSSSNVFYIFLYYSPWLPLMILWFGPIWHGVPRLAKYPLVSGVYLISEKEKNRKIVRYVGQAQNIKDRMERHQNDESNPELKKLLTHHGCR